MGNDFRGRFVQPPGLKGTLEGPAYRGYSAYEIAVRNGFIGTEQEWLESLKGEPGQTPKVTANRTGSKQTTIYVDGEPVAIILDGVDGMDGVTPERGKDYWTAADKAEIVQEVLRSLVPEGEFLLGGDNQS